MENDEKVLIITSEIPEDAEYDYEEDAREEIKIDTHSEIDTIIAALIKDICSPAGMTSLLKDESFQSALIQNGWMDQDTAKNLEGVTGKNNFFTALKQDYHYTYEHLSLVQPDPYSIDRLAEGKCLLLQEIDKKCLKELAPEFQKKIVARKKQNAAIDKKAKARKKEKAAQKKQKDIEKARKLLEDAGEIAK